MEQGVAERPVVSPFGGAGAIGAERVFRVLIVHNSYQIRGGEDTVVEQEAMALRRAGHDIKTATFSNDGIRSMGDRLRTAANTAHAPHAIRKVLQSIEQFRPEIVHVHNFFPLISPGVHAAARSGGAATVQTLHNFRVTCANGLLLREGKPCEICVTGSPYNAVRYGCYRGSRLGSLAVARMISVHRRAGTWISDVDRFIALTDFAKLRFVAAGLPSGRIAVKPNGLDDLGPPDERSRSGILYVGRLSEEKGLRTLAAAARLSHARVSLIGDGPLRDELSAEGKLLILGPKTGPEVRMAMASAQAIVVPSIWYEGFPMVIAEAFASATPVIVSSIGALPALVEHQGTGLHVQPGDPVSVARALDSIADEPEQARNMGRRARSVFERCWSSDVTTRALVSIYDEAWRSRQGVADVA